MPSDFALAVKWYAATALFAAGILIAGFYLMVPGRSRRSMWEKWRVIYLTFFVGYAWWMIGLFAYLTMTGLQIGEKTLYLDGIVETLYRDGFLEDQIPLSIKIMLLGQTIGAPIIFVIFAIAVERHERRREV